MTTLKNGGPRTVSRRGLCDSRISTAEKNCSSRVLTARVLSNLRYKLAVKRRPVSVRRKIEESFGVYFITFTCARWLPLFDITDGYAAVYKWFDYLKGQKHHLVGYVIMSSHVHALIAFNETRTLINTIIAYMELQDIDLTSS
jgi:hypothetical protein